MECSKSSNPTNDESIFVNNEYKSPDIIYSSVIGGDKNDAVYGVATDILGNSYLTGCTTSTNFKTTNKVIGLQKITTSAVFIIKIDNSNRLVYSTIINGDNDDYAYKIVVDEEGCPYIIGRTLSTADSLNAINVYGDLIDGQFSIFVAKLTTDGSRLSYLTYISGEGSDTGNSLVLSNEKKLYIVAVSSSANWLNIFKSNYNSFGYNSSIENKNIIVSNLNSNGEIEKFITISGNKDTYINGIDISINKNIFINGTTNSRDFGEINLSRIGSFESIDSFKIIVCKINSNLNNIEYLTIIGGSDEEAGTGIAVDCNENAYITGNTKSSNYPGKSKYYVSNINNYNALIINKLSTDGSKLEYSTLIGGSNGQLGLRIKLDEYNNAYVVGYTDSLDYPVLNQLWTPNNKGFNGLISVVDKDGSKLKFSSLIGGSGYDFINDLSIEVGNNITVVGTTTSSDIPLSKKEEWIALGNLNGFLLRAGLDEVTLNLDIIASPSPVTLEGRLNYNLTITNKGSMVANNVVVTYILSDDIIIGVINTEDGSISKTKQKVIWNFNRLPVGESKSLNVEAFPMKTGEVQSIATVKAETDNLIANEAKSSTMVVSIYDIVSRPNYELDLIKSQINCILEYVYKEHCQLDWMKNEIRNYDKKFKFLQKKINCVAYRASETLEGQENILENFENLSDKTYDNNKKLLDIINYQDDKLKKLEKSLDEVEKLTRKKSNILEDKISKIDTNINMIVAKTCKNNNRATSEISTGIVSKNKDCNSAIIVIRNISLIREQFKFKLYDKESNNLEGSSFDINLFPHCYKVLLIKSLPNLYEGKIIGNVNSLEGCIKERINSYMCNLQDSSFISSVLFR